MTVPSAVLCEARRVLVGRAGPQRRDGGARALVAGWRHRRQRDPQGEGGAEPLLAPDRHRAAVVAGDVLDDRQAQAGAAGAARPGLVDPVEALEDPRPVRPRDADAAVGDRDLGEPGPGPGGRPRSSSRWGCRRRRWPAGWSARWPAGSPRRARRGRAAPRRRAGCPWPRPRPGCGRPPRPRPVRLDSGTSSGSGSAPCSRDRSISSRTSRASRSASWRIRAAKRCTASGSSAAPCDRLGQQRQRADRRLQLVPDVGDEVAADRLDPAGLGDVRAAPARPGRASTHRCRCPAGRRARRPAGGRLPTRSPGSRDVGAPAAADLHAAGQLDQVGHQQPVAAHDAQRAGGGVGQQHRVVGADAAPRRGPSGRPAGG